MHVAEIVTKEALEGFRGGEIILTNTSGHNSLSKGVVDEIIDVGDDWTRVLVTITHHGIGNPSNLGVVDWKESVATNQSSITLQSPGHIVDDGRITFDNDREPRRSVAVITRA